MLSIGAVKSAGGASAYYTAEDNYYFLGESSTEWFGKGAEQLGLAGLSVDSTRFENVLKGHISDDANLAHFRNGKNVHQAGYDFVFSAPKSVSVLALVAEDKSLLAAHQNAVKKALSEIETFVSTRTMIDGVPIQNSTGNLLSALFTHDTSRNLDPQLHTHAIVANATFDELTGKWKTISSDRSAYQNFVESMAFTNTVFKNQVALGSLYRQFLKEEVQDLGYSVRMVDKNNLWEIEGVPQSLLDSFSTRREEILENALPNASQKSLTYTALDTRKEKEFENMEAVKQEWQQKLTESGLKIEELKNLPKDDKAVISLNAKEAVAEAVSELEREKAKFSYSDIFTRSVNLAHTEQNIAKQIHQEVNSLIKDGRLVMTDQHHSIYTSSYHLEQERDVSVKMSAKEKELSHISETAGTRIGEQLKDKQSNFNLVSIRGSSAFEKSVLDDVASVAKSNEMNYLVVVRNYDDKMSLVKGAGYKGDVVTLNDYLSSGKPEKNTIVSVFGAEKISLNKMNDVLDKSLENGDTLAVIDTGGRKFSGLTRDVAESIGIEPLKLTEKAQNRQMVFAEKVDRADQITQGVKAYTMSRFTGKENTMLQVSSGIMSATVSKVRESLKNAGILGGQDITLKSREFVYVKNFNDKTVYQVGNLLEQKGSEGKSYFRIEAVHKEKGLLSVSSLGNPKATQTFSMKDLNKNALDWKMYKEKDLPVAMGEKLKASGAFSGVKIGEELTVTGLKKGFLFFKDKVVLENSKGLEVSIPTDKVAYLQQNYVEAYGASKNDSRDRIIAVVGQQNMDSRTLTEIGKGSDDVLVITSLAAEKIQDKVNQDKATVTVTDSLKSFFGSSELENIKTASMQREGEFLDRVVNLNIEKAILSTKDKVSFIGLDVVRSVAEQGFDQNQVRAYLANEIKQGNIIPLDKNNPSLNGEFVPLAGLRTEQKILELAEQGIGAREPILSDISGINFSTLTKANGAVIELTSGQQNTAKMLLTNTNTFGQTIGFAGVGKTAALEFVRGIIQDQQLDTKLVALAPTHQAVSEMVKVGLDSGATYQSFLQQHKEGNLAPDQFKNTLFLIDEVSMMGNSDLLNVMELVANYGGKAQFIGDPDQLKSIASGTPFALLAQRGQHAISTMQQIVRQNEELRPVIYEIIADQIPSAIKELNQLDPKEFVPRLENAESPTQSVISLPQEGKNYAIDDKVYAVAAKDYLSRTEEAREQTLLIVPTNKGVKSLNERVHQGLVEMGVVSQTISVPTLQQKNLTAADMQDPTTWIKNRGNVLKMGNDYYQIGSIDNKGNVGLFSTDGNEKWVNTYHISADNAALYEQVNQEMGVGDKIRFRATEKDSIVSNNAVGTIKSIDQDGKMTIDLGKAGIVKRDPLNDIGDRHVTLGYAVTVHASQGASYQYGINVIPRSSFHFQALDSFYVALSRAIKHAQVYTNDVDGLVQTIHQTGRGERLTTHDKIELSDKLAEQKIEDALKLKGRTEVQQEKELWKNADELPLATFDKNTKYFAKHDKDNSELLLKVVDDTGRHRGNYHIPYSLLSGKMEEDKAYYKGDFREDLQIRIGYSKDGEREQISFNSISDYLESGKFSSDEPKVILLNDKALGAKDVIQDQENKELQETKDVQVVLNEIKQDEHNEQKLAESIIADDTQIEGKIEPNNDDKYVQLAFELEQEDKLQEAAILEQNAKDEQKESEFNRLGNDEANIIHHNEKDKEADDEHQPMKTQEKTLV